MTNNYKLTDDYKLTIEIENYQPIELVDFTNSLLSIADEYRRFLIRQDGSMAAEEIKLYIKGIKSSTIITELVPYAPYTLLAIEYASTVIDFAGYLKMCIGFFIGKEKKEPQLEKVNYENFSNLLEPIAKDRAAQLNCHTVIKGDVSLVLNVSSLEANAAQNNIKKKIESLKEPMYGTKKKVLLYWFQARKDPKSKFGNQATIESIHSSPVRVIMDEDLKKEILAGSENPFKMAYIVDVEVETIRNKPAVYKITNLHDSFGLNNNGQIKMFED